MAGRKEGGREGRRSGKNEKREAQEGCGLVA